MATKYGSFQIEWFKIFGHSLSIFNPTPLPGFLEHKGYHWTLGLRVEKAFPSHHNVQLNTMSAVAMARISVKVQSGNPYSRKRISTVDLLVLTSSDQLLFIWKPYFFSFFFKQPSIMRRSTVLTLPLH